MEEDIKAEEVSPPKVNVNLNKSREKKKQKSNKSRNRINKVKTEVISKAQLYKKRNEILAKMPL